MTFEIAVGDRIRAVNVARKGALLHVTVDGRTHVVDARRVSDASVSMLLQNAAGDLVRSVDVAVASRHNGKIWQGSDMTEGRSIEELDRRIAILRDNLRQLIEQAAARSGAADEALASDRIAQQSEELDRLTKERAALVDAQGKS